MVKLFLFFHALLQEPNAMDPLLLSLLLLLSLWWLFSRLWLHSSFSLSLSCLGGWLLLLYPPPPLVPLLPFVLDRRAGQIEGERESWVLEWENGRTVVVAAKSFASEWAAPVLLLLLHYGCITSSKLHRAMIRSLRRMKTSISFSLSLRARKVIILFGIIRKK